MLPPIVLSPVFKEKIWGGQNLSRRLHKDIPADRPIGECWEVSGVTGDETTALSAPFAGMTLDAIMRRSGAVFLGLTPPADAGFPLLYKFIDAQDKLSVQVHPDDAQAQANGWGNYGKTECWYIVDAVPGAQIICGVNPGVSLADIRRGIKKNTLQKYLNVIDISAGDVVFVPAGTIHAIGAGTLLYEVQQTSDTTFRLYDWGRTDAKGKPRALHVEQALAVMELAAHHNHKITPVTVSRSPAVERRLRVVSAYFALEEYEWIHPGALTFSPRQSFAVCTLMRGRAAALFNDKLFRECKTGDTLLLPAQSIRSVTIEAVAGTLLMVSWAPHLSSEIIAPLRAAGADGQAIGGLGGNPLHNALMPLL